MSVQAEIKEPKREEVTIFINDERKVAPKTAMTGAEIKALGNIPIQNRLFKEEPGIHPDKPIADNETVQLKNGDKFYDLPPGVVGG